MLKFCIKTWFKGYWRKGHKAQLNLPHFLRKSTDNLIIDICQLTQALSYNILNNCPFFFLAVF